METEEQIDFFSLLFLLLKIEHIDETVYRPK